MSYKSHEFRRKRISGGAPPGDEGEDKVNIMRLLQLLPMVVLLALGACVPYAGNGVYWPLEDTFLYPSPTPYYFYPYYSNPYGYYYYPHPQRHVKWVEQKGGRYRGQPSGHVGGGGGAGHGGRH
jgi:hypothetical protein